MLETSDVVLGKTTAITFSPLNRPVQSVMYVSKRSASVAVVRMRLLSLRID